MKGKPGPPATLLRPILDTYMGSAVALVGCASRGMERYSCELDVLVVSKDRRPSTSLRFGKTMVDLKFVHEGYVLRPANPEHSMALALSRPIRDSALLLSTASAAGSATMSSSARAAARTRLASSLKTISRAEDALGKGSLVDSDFWLLAATYEFAYALLLAKETLPSPSHLLSQLRAESRGMARGFECVSIGAGLESAIRAGCGARLEGIAVIHDLLREGSKSATADSEWSPTRSEIVSAKATELMTRAELAECYSYLGQELVDGMLALLKAHPNRSLGSLTSGGNRLLGERLLRQLGLAREEKSLKAGLEAVRRQVALLAKKA